MNFGIIGTGMIGAYHAQAIQAMSGGNLYGVAGRNPERASEMAKQFNVRSFASVDEMLAERSIDIITICTPSGAHFEPAMAAIEAGKHVIVEKPLEVTVERIDKMRAAADTAGVTLAAVLNRRFKPAVEAARQAVAEGRFGQLNSASAYIKWFRDQAYYDSAAWRGTWALDGGGVLMNQGIHSIDILLHLAGPVKTVQANTACLSHEGIEVEDIAVALLEFQNGARGVIEGSTCSWSSTGHPARIQLAGTEGSLFLADETVEIWDFMHEAPEDERIRTEYRHGAGVSAGGNDPNTISFHKHQLNFEEIVTAINEGREPSTSATEARKGVELLEAIYKSARENGAKITLPSSI
jgi:predicted dehydrogenase